MLPATLRASPCAPLKEPPMASKTKGKPLRREKQSPPKPTGFGVRPGPAPWQASYGTYLTGHEAIEDMQMIASQMEDKWGKGRLRLLVPADLREKFDRQRYLTNQAVWLGELEDVKQQTKRMINAWQALDKQATLSGAEIKPVEQWEALLDDGTTLIVVKTLEEASQVKIEGRKAVVWSLEEVARVVDEQKAILMAKIYFPGAVVEGFERIQKDPLDAFTTSLAGLDDDLSDMLPPEINPLMG